MPLIATHDLVYLLSIDRLKKTHVLSYGKCHCLESNKNPMNQNLLMRLLHQCGRISAKVTLYDAAEFPTCVVAFQAIESVVYLSRDPGE